MLETSMVSIDALVHEIDVLIRARYPLLSVSTFEEGRFRHLMRAVAGLDRHKPKGLYAWSRTLGLRQLAGPGVGLGERLVPGAEDPASVLAMGALIAVQGNREMVPVPEVVVPIDTTAAGDSFNAGYIAGRLSGEQRAELV